MSFLFGESVATDLKDLIATVRWTVAGEGSAEPILYFCQGQKCKQIWAVPPNENPFTKVGGFLFVFFVLQYSSFIIH